MTPHKIIVRNAAEIDIAEAARWYELRDQGLGTEFLRCIDVCISAITRKPLQYPLVFQNIRRALLRKFPFAIFYLIDSENVIVLACLHTKRHPSVFKSRN